MKVIAYRFTLYRWRSVQVGLFMASKTVELYILFLAGMAFKLRSVLSTFLSIWWLKRATSLLAQFKLIDSISWYDASILVGTALQDFEEIWTFSFLAIMVCSCSLFRVPWSWWPFTEALVVNDLLQNRIDFIYFVLWHDPLFEFVPLRWKTVFWSSPRPPGLERVARSAQLYKPLVRSSFSPSIVETGSKESSLHHIRGSTGAWTMHSKPVGLTEALLGST